MRHIIFVKGLDSEEKAQQISETLDETRLKYTVSVISSSVTVEGSNDSVYTAKQAIMLAGFMVQ
ncbi:MAG: copper chaperone [Erysipelothrix sp.]